VRPKRERTSVITEHCVVYVFIYRSDTPRLHFIDLCCGRFCMPVATTPDALIPVLWTYLLFRSSHYPGRTFLFRVPFHIYVFLFRSYIPRVARITCAIHSAHNHSFVKLVARSLKSEHSWVLSISHSRDLYDYESIYLQHIVKTYYNNVLKIRDIHLNKTCDNCNCIAYIYNQQLFSRR
jgi:hypothetical protein